MPVVSVREHAWLTTEPVASTLDLGQVSESAFDHLCTLCEGFTRSGARLVQVAEHRRLKLDSHVGVLHTPCGTTLEVLPKLHEQDDDPDRCRAILSKMARAVPGLPAREAGTAPLEPDDVPPSEWVMRRFLDELDSLVKHGLRFDYQRVEAEMPFLRGQLNLGAQLRQPPGQAHRFHVRHDLYLPNRPENRLLRLALERVRRATQNPDNWRLAQELSFRLAEVPPSRQVSDDFMAWGTDRLMAHYRAVKPWCELILRRLLPLAVLGTQWGMSLMLPMEKLFERYVASWLRAQMRPGTDIRTPAAFRSLCVHQGEPLFQLEPDVYVAHGAQRWVLDMKWKRLDAGDREGQYGLSQADFYQLFAYGHKYLQGHGQMALIYPASERFQQELAPFQMGDLTLHVLPFDLQADALLGMAPLNLPLINATPATTAS